MKMFSALFLLEHPVVLTMNVKKRLAVLELRKAMTIFQGIKNVLDKLWEAH